MLSGRMLKLIDFLQNNYKTTYKEISNELQIKERYIRYDIDRINSLLEFNKMPLIEKHSKGVIIFPKNSDISSFAKEKNFIYSQEERTSLILLILLIDNKRLKINKLSLDFQVSRSTIKNDMTLLEENLSKNNIKINYTDHFFLDGIKSKRVALLNNEFKKYIYLLKEDVITLNAFEVYAIDIIEKAFLGIEMKDLIKWIDELLEEMNCILTEDSYKWYVSNIFVVIWFVLKGKENPLESTISMYNSHKYDEYIKKLEEIINIKIDRKKQKVLIRLLNYINKNAGLDGDIDLIFIETIVANLITTMSEEMSIDFSKDSILVEGLLNHIVPLIKRITSRINICDEVFSILSDKDMEVFKIVKDVIREIDGLKDIENYDEITYLSIHFIASIKRLTKVLNKKVLLVCGHGYGTTTILKETLLNEYQINIIDTIPVYKLLDYNNWEKIDCIISTTKLNISNEKDCVVVNPLLSDKDYINIDKLGINRKKITANYYSINRKLDFLNDSDRRKVLEIIKNELGCKNMEMQSVINKLSDLLIADCIKISYEKKSWREIVSDATRLLENQKFIDKRYENDIISTIETIGFYSVTDEYFALLHGKGGEGVKCSCMSLIVSKEAIEFGTKKARIIFCLASKDNKEHIPAIIMLMKMIKSTNLIKNLEQANSLNEIKEVIRKSELEVIL
ncbi:BglG family transcription antiterminator [Clostridium nigeriense]|uniref:BglG family transcription antiterminator n=1 Tax=Clostridium nigeriense TaxID=1805470 RepID=UPI003D3519F2